VDFELPVGQGPHRRETLGVLRHAARSKIGQEAG